MNLFTVTFICSLLCCTINCQYPLVDNNFYPGYPGYGGGYGSGVSGGCSGFAGMFSYLMGGNRCCGGGCGSGSPIVYYPVPVPPPPNPPCPPTTTTAPVPSCSVTIDHGPFYPWMCDQTLTPATVSGCPTYRVTFQLLGGVPCTYLESNGVIRYSTLGGSCAVGPGYVYTPTLTATDSLTGAILATSQIQINTQSLSFCTTTTTTGAPACNVHIDAGPLPVWLCSPMLLSPVQISGCPASRVSVQLSGMPCTYLQSNGTILFDSQSGGCAVGPGYVYSGIITATDNWTGATLATSQFQIDTAEMGYCAGTTTTTAGPPACNVTYSLSQTWNSGIYFPTSCQQQLFSPTYINCYPPRISWSFGDIWCLQALPNGTIMFNADAWGCEIDGSRHLGTMIIIDEDTPPHPLGGPFGTTWYIQLYTAGLEYCKATTTTATSTTTTIGGG
ncbi:uncharacterized protein LOC129598232 [Paramacrobiotus metropolitanus]|uniref:uncharacterized protein LOC129598232 n=1 Tax=Paramacrobiotus metropolitanus TaxID=2943436 RepID=UPI002445802F|nr:uncharacterized protein LOC129598232 [Paramacrobiotus metropolitanus]